MVIKIHEIRKELISKAANSFKPESNWKQIGYIYK